MILDASRSTIKKRKILMGEGIHCTFIAMGLKFVSVCSKFDVERGGTQVAYCSV